MDFRTLAHYVRYKRGGRVLNYSVNTTSTSKQKITPKLDIPLLYWSGSVRTSMTSLLTACHATSKQHNCDIILIWCRAGDRCWAAGRNELFPLRCSPVYLPGHRLCLPPLAPRIPSAFPVSSTNSDQTVERIICVPWLAWGWPTNSGCLPSDRIDLLVQLWLGICEYENLRNVTAENKKGAHPNHITQFLTTPASATFGMTRKDLKSSGILASESISKFCITISPLNINHILHQPSRLVK